MIYCKNIFLIILFSFLIFSCEEPEEIIYEYSLLDINTSSNTYNISIGPQYYNNTVTVHYFGHQYWDLCTSLVGEFENLNQNLLAEGIDNVKIIAIGKEQYSSSNENWIDISTFPIVLDPLPNTLWLEWGASQWDVFFIDANGKYVTDINVKSWDYSQVYNQIKDIIAN